jgi:hypothetical protein
MNHRAVQLGCAGLVKAELAWVVINAGEHAIVLVCSVLVWSMPDFTGRGSMSDVAGATNVRFSRTSR